MAEINKKNRQYLLNIARQTIIKKVKNIWLSKDEIKSLESILHQKRGGFVTLQKHGNLRGCIGYILPIKKLYETVIENAYNAAYSDFRFPPVTEDEIKELEIEISVLTVPQALKYQDSSDLLDKLNPLQDGVILSKGYSSATFLPQVWEQLPNKKDFLSHLCLKAGLSQDQWKIGDLQVEIYHAEMFAEN